MISTIISQEPLMDDSRPLLRQLLRRLIDKQLEPQPCHFDLTKVGHGGSGRSLMHPGCMHVLWL
jgi:hypothetical protein